MILLGLGASYWQMQQALRWWYQRAALERAAQTYQIQNRTMQDLFALRLSLSAASSSSQLDALAIVDRLHHSLNNLSETLTHSYLNDSLPLAIQALLQQWQLGHPAQQIQLDLPSDWPLDPSERSQLILETLAAWLELTAAPEIPASLGLRLKQQAGRAELTLRWLYPDNTQIAATHAKELRYLRDCFRCLMPGHCHSSIRSQVAEWQFSWKIRLSTVGK